MKIILNIGTHGDEHMGLKVAHEIDKIRKKDNVNVLVQIANKKAFDLRIRYVDQDLNRSFPGRKNGNHEENLAYTLSPIIKDADIVIDIHSTTSDLKDALIVTKLDKDTLSCVKAIKPKYLLVMNATKNTALISQAKIGIAFEYGKDDDSIAIHETVLGVTRLLKHLNIIDTSINSSKTKTYYFDVFSMVHKPEGFSLLKGIKNYKEVHKGQPFASNGRETIVAENDFFPILFGEKKYKDYFGFAARKIRQIDVGRL